MNYDYSVLVKLSIYPFLVISEMKIYNAFDDDINVSFVIQQECQKHSIMISSTEFVHIPKLIYQIFCYLQKKGLLVLFCFFNH